MSSQSIESQLQKIAAELATLARTVTSEGAGKAEAYRAQAGHYAQDALSMSRDAWSDLQSEFGSLERTVVNRVRSHPLQTVGIVAGIALLVALTSSYQVKSKP